MNHLRKRERLEKRTVRERGNGVAAWSIGAALIAALTVFGVMLRMEQSLLSDYEKKNVYVAACPIPGGELITPENVRQYFAERELDASCVPERALSCGEDAIGLVAAAGIDEGALLTSGMFRRQDDAPEGLTEPVIAGLRADRLDQVAGGVLRAGDIIHIYAVDEWGETRLVWSNVLVQQVFDSAGVSIPETDKSTAASMVNVYLESGNVEEFYRQTNSNSLRVVKVCKPDSRGQ